MGNSLKYTNTYLNYQGKEEGVMQMPTSPLMCIPKTSSAEEFEAMCVDVLQMEYGVPFCSYGRKGQIQNGIDLFASNLQGDIVVQCKNYHLSSYEKLRKQLSNDIESVCQSDKFKIVKFIAMTSMNRDNETQDFIRKLNYSFPIEIFFWEDIQSRICGNRVLLSKYYPDYNEKIPVKILNKIIEYTKVLEQYAIDFYRDNSYEIAKCFEKDCIVYNKCISMHMALQELHKIKTEWYLQLQKNGTSHYIEQLEESIPSIYDANSDNSGANMVYTISKFYDYFYNVDKTNKFENLCCKIIRQTEVLYQESD